MSTRSVVGTIDLSTGAWKGRYVHFDGYPTARGPVLAQILANVDGGLNVLNHTIAAQGAGWSSLTGKLQNDRPTGDNAAFVNGFGTAYRDAPGADDWITGTVGEEFDDVFIEWGYFFTGDDPATASLLVFGFPYPAGPAGALAVIPARVLHQVTDNGWEHVEGLKYAEDETPNYGITDLAALRATVEDYAARSLEQMQRFAIQASPEVVDAEIVEA